MQRIGAGLSAFVTVDNLADSQDPNTDVLLPTGSSAAIYRPDAGRTARIGVQVVLLGAVTGFNADRACA